MMKVQLEHEIENNGAKDRIISDLRAQIQRNDLSRSSSLVQLQTQLVDREVLCCLNLLETNYETRWINKIIGSRNPTIAFRIG